jgi:hypothetical protein
MVGLYYVDCRLPIGECRSSDWRLTIENAALPIGIEDCRLDWGLSIGNSIGNRQCQSTLPNLILQSSIKKSAIGNRHSPMA